jgi:hypothetical protein
MIHKAHILKISMFSLINVSTVIRPLARSFRGKEFGKLMGVRKNAAHEGSSREKSHVQGLMAGSNRQAG